MKKKILLLAICFITIFFTSGCGKNNNVFKKIKDKYDNLKSYTLTGNLEIINNDDTYKYDVKVSYQKNDKYYVSLKNRDNNHEQIILKNEDGVYVLTPSLNKSFKFQSNWPYNNSQIYLIQSIIDDIDKDKEKDFVKSKEGYIYTVNVNYPNNRMLVKQEVKFDKDYNLLGVNVVDENGISKMKIDFQTIDLKPNIDKNTFDLNRIMENNNVTKEETEKTGTLDTLIYPLYIPTGTVLTNSETIAKDNGERVIMTFDGEKPFLLVEETASVLDEFSIIPTSGELYLLIDTVAALSDTSITWSSNGIDYYLVSDVLSQNELIDIARSVSVIPVIK